MSCYYSSSRASQAASDAREAKEKASQALREAKRLREQFDKMQRDQAEILENQKKILSAFADMVGAVRDMQAEMYPTVQNTKPAMKMPGKGSRADG